jgi:DNA replication protein DnaC
MRLTKSKLDSMGITALKKEAKLMGISGFSKYRSVDKDDLVNIIWSQILKGSKPNPVSSKKTPKKDTPIKKTPKYKKVELKFKDKDLMNIELDLNRYDNSKPIKQLAPVTPEKMLELLKNDIFVNKIIRSLKGIYNEKIKKYTKLENRLMKSIKNDTSEKKKMESSVNSSDLDKMFPMLSVNFAFLIKVQKILDEAIKKIKIMKANSDSTNIKNVRKNFIEAITDPDDGIMSITGDSRGYIRNNMTRQLYILSKGYKPFMDAFINMVFTGPAGVGKTKLAKAVGFMFSKSGILLFGDVIVVSPKDLVAGFVGQTAGRTAGILMKGLESIIFIDEAYQIMDCVDGKIAEGKSFGGESITEIVNFLDKYVGLSIMIVAGYQREIDGCFFGANQGLQRRFPIRWTLPKYSILDLLNIFINEANRRIGGNNFTKEISLYIYTIMVLLYKEDNDIFISQAGDIMNLVSIFLNVYYGSYGLDWGEYDSDLVIVNETFNQFLKNKDYLMKIK